ncbi:hypothetical protein L596_000393 [Steinernema carpocapsae]|uniref:Uncharacterized protein n=1 Tax=Steinernema carpocapsae TaxID=34508 RepID=A0A4V6YSS6_STECR|nr:hypothetical protein L596_000393 [Steinernema carpocapsae]
MSQQNLFALILCRHCAASGILVLAFWQNEFVHLRNPPIYFVSRCNCCSDLLYCQPYNLKLTQREHNQPPI